MSECQVVNGIKMVVGVQEVAVSEPQIILHILPVMAIEGTEGIHKNF